MEKNEYKEATTGNVVKFVKQGDSIEGAFIGTEESKQFQGSYALSVSDKEETKVAFVSGIVIDLIKKNGIIPGNQIKVVFQGKKKTQDNKREYNDYKVFFK